jgi:hypothetical protein
MVLGTEGDLVIYVPAAASREATYFVKSNSSAYGCQHAGEAVGVRLDWLVVLSLCEDWTR